MWHRIKDWIDDYDLFAIVLLNFAIALVIGALLGKTIVSKYDEDLQSLKNRVEIMQEHIVECIDENICEHYTFE